MLKKGNKKEPLNEYSLQYEDIPLFPRNKKVNKKERLLDNNSNDRHRFVLVTRFMATWYNRSSRFYHRVVLFVNKKGGK